MKCSINVGHEDANRWKVPFFGYPKMAESLNAGEACILHQKLAKLLSDSQYLLKHLELNLPPPPFLVCPVCLDLLNSPRVLPCTHVLCSACILGMTKAAKEDDWGRPRAIQGNFTCPVCRREVEWEELGKNGSSADISASKHHKSIVPIHFGRYLLAWERLSLNSRSSYKRAELPHY